MVGDTVGRAVTREDLIVSTVHSGFDKNPEQGSEGFARAINVIMNNRHASTRKPDLSTLKNISMRQRRAYQRTC